MSIRKPKPKDEVCPVIYDDGSTMCINVTEMRKHAKRKRRQVFVTMTQRDIVEGWLTKGLIDVDHVKTKVDKLDDPILTITDGGFGHIVDGKHRYTCAVSCSMLTFGHGQIPVPTWAYTREEAKRFCVKRFIQNADAMFHYFDQNGYPV